MADRSFEEQVRKEMEPLRLQPDAAVWEHISASLVKDKRRYRILWVVLLIVAGAGAWGIYEWTATPAHPLAPAQPAAVAAHDKAVSSENTITASGSSDNINTATSGKPGNTFRETIHQPAIAINRRNAQADAAITHIISAESAIAPTGTTVKQPAGNANVLPGVRQEEVPANTGTAAASQQVPATNVSTNNIQSNTSITATDSTAVNANTQPAPTPSTAKDSAEAGAGNPVVRVKKIRRPWTFEVSGAAGIAGAGRPLTTNGAMYYSAPNGNITGGQYNPGSPNAGIGAVVYKIPSEKQGSYTALAITAMAPAGKKSGIGFSLGYARYTNLIGVGRRVDTATASLGNTFQKNDGDFVYLSTDSTRYTNRFHFLSLGVQYYVPFSLGKSVSARWKAGAGAGILLATNALQFDDGKGVLYTNRSSWTSLQWNLSTGFDIGIGKQPSLFIGPQVGYSLSKTSGTSSGRHLWSAALGATYTLSRKKK